MDFDFESIQQAVDLAGNTGAATGKVASALTTVKALFQGSETGANGDVERAIGELTLEVANAQHASALLVQKVTSLQMQLSELQAFNSDKERYELWETPMGSVVYRLKETERNGEPLHYLCPLCIEKKVKAILQGRHSKQCISCTAFFHFQKPPAINLG